MANNSYTWQKSTTLQFRLTLEDYPEPLTLTNKQIRYTQGCFWKKVSNSTSSLKDTFSFLRG